MPLSERPKNSITFDERLEELKAFKVKYGHCRVPPSNSVYKSLATWCADMRYAYKLSKKGKKTTSGRLINDERVNRLNAVGFHWGSPEIIKLSTRKTFHVWLEELKTFKRIHGHCKVPQYGDTKSLGSWYRKMKLAYCDFMAGRTVSSGRYMDAGKARLLEDVIGIELVSYVRRKPRAHRMGNKTFYDWKQELEEFKKKHGHCNVPTFGATKSLGRWCSQIRRAYIDFKTGKPIRNGRSLNAEKAKLLEAMNLEWLYIPDPALCVSNAGVL